MLKYNISKHFFLYLIPINTTQRCYGKYCAYKKYSALMDVSMSTVLQLWNQLAVKTFFGVNLIYLCTTVTGTKLTHLLIA